MTDVCIAIYTVRHNIGELPVFVLLNSLSLIRRASRTFRTASHQLRQDKHQDTIQKSQFCFIGDSSASWLRPVCSGFHNLIRSNCAPFFASCSRHRVLPVVLSLDACRCAAYLNLHIWSKTKVVSLGSIVFFRDAFCKSIQSLLRVFLIVVNTVLLLIDIVTWRPRGGIAHY
jgi:hypothetical protein